MIKKKKTNYQDHMHKKVIDYNIMYKETNIIHYLIRRSRGIFLPYQNIKIVLFPRKMEDY